jgi:hypothetical protein
MLRSAQVLQGKLCVSRQCNAENEQRYIYWSNEEGGEIEESDDTYTSARVVNTGT